MCKAIKEGGRRCKHQDSVSREAQREANLQPATVKQARKRAERLYREGCFAAAGITNPIVGKDDAWIEQHRDEINTRFAELPGLNPMVVRNKRTPQEVLRDAASAAEMQVDAQARPVASMWPDASGQSEASGTSRRTAPGASETGGTSSLDNWSEHPDLMTPDGLRSEATMLAHLDRLRGLRAAALSRRRKTLLSTVRESATSQLEALDAAISRVEEEVAALPNWTEHVDLIVPEGPRSEAEILEHLNRLRTLREVAVKRQRGNSSKDTRAFAAGQVAKVDAVLREVKDQHFALISAKR